MANRVPLMKYLQKDVLERFRATFTQSLSEGHGFSGALREAGAYALKEEGEYEAMVQAVANLAVDFEERTGASVHRDPIVIERLLSGVVKLSNELQTDESAELNLPFLTATTEGPLHLQRLLSREEFTDLCTRPGRTPKPPKVTKAQSASEELDQAEAEAARKMGKKKSWWPF